jgi:uncharacterized protein (TIGR03437 family)
LVNQEGSPAQLTGPILALNAASFMPGLASATWMTVMGTGLAASTRTWQAADFVGNKLPTELDGVSVRVNGKAAFVHYVSPTQINFLAPDDDFQGSVQVEVSTPDRQVYSATAFKQQFSPAFFMFQPEGWKYIAALHPDGTLLAKPGLFPGIVTRAAKSGGVISLYGTGFGPTIPFRPTGEIVTAPASLATRSLVVKIGNVPATVLFAGLTGAGLYQFNVIVPPLPDGDQPVAVEIDSFRTQAGAYITVKNE